MEVTFDPLESAPRNASRGGSPALCIFKFKREINANNTEKQKILEAVSLTEKVRTLENIINFYLHEVNFNNQTIQ